MARRGRGGFRGRRRRKQRGGGTLRQRIGFRM